MPTYPFRCTDCDTVEDRYMSVAEYEQTRDNQRCSRCEGRMNRVFTPPALLGTDTRFFSGSDDYFGEDNHSRQKAIANATAEGISVSGKKYYPQLCRAGRPLDPQAWCGSQAEIKQKLQAMGRGAEGSINLPVRQKEEPKKEYRVADSIVESEVHSVMRQQGLKSLTPKEKKQLRADVRKRISPADGIPA